jgi:amidase
VSLGPEEAEAWAGLVMRHVVSHSVRDSAAILDAIHGYMTGDYYTAPPPGRAYAREATTDPGKLRIGIRTAAPLGLAEVDAECVTATENTARLLESLGHTVEVSSPAALDDFSMMESFLAVMNAALRADLQTHGEKIGHEFGAADVEAGTWNTFEAAGAIDAAAYVRALAKMHQWTRSAVAWWEDDGYDILVTPVCAEPPPELGDLIRPETNGARLLPFAVFTAPFNVTGQPAMSVPLHWTPSGLPVGVQFTGAPFREDALFRLAGQLEQAQGWAGRQPPVHA